MEYKHFFDIGYKEGSNKIRRYSPTFPLVAGKWKFVSDVSGLLLSSDSTIESCFISFSSNDELFKEIILTNTALKYGRSIGLSSVTVFENGAWVDEKYREITISDTQYLEYKYFKILNSSFYYTPTAGAYTWVENPCINSDWEITYNVDDMEVNIQVYSMTADNTFGELVPISSVTCSYNSSNDYSLTIEGRSAERIIFNQDGWKYQNVNGDFTATDTEKLRTIIIETSSAPFLLEGTRFSFLWKNLIANTQYFLLSGDWINTEFEIVSGSFTGIPVLYTTQDNANMIILGEKGKQVISNDIGVSFGNFCNLFDIIKTESGNYFEANEYNYSMAWGGRLSTSEGTDGGTIGGWNISLERIKELNGSNFLIAKYNFETDSAAVYEVSDYDPQTGTITMDMELSHNDIFTILYKNEEQ